MTLQGLRAMRGWPDFAEVAGWFGEENCLGEDSRKIGAEISYFRLTFAEMSARVDVTGLLGWSGG
jgi:hypothetical protein